MSLSYWTSDPHFQLLGRQVIFSGRTSQFFSQLSGNLVQFRTLEFLKEYFHETGLLIHGNFLQLFTHFKSSQSTTSLELRQDHCSHFFLRFMVSAFSSLPVIIPAYVNLYNLTLWTLLYK